MNMHIYERPKWESTPDRNPCIIECLILTVFLLQMKEFNIFTLYYVSGFLLARRCFLSVRCRIWIWKPPLEMLMQERLPRARPRLTSANSYCWGMLLGRAVVAWWPPTPVVAASVVVAFPPWCDGRLGCLLLVLRLPPRGFFIRLNSTTLGCISWWYWSSQGVVPTKLPASFPERKSNANISMSVQNWNFSEATYRAIFVCLIHVVKTSMQLWMHTWHLICFQKHCPSMWQDMPIRRMW